METQNKLTERTIDYGLAVIRYCGLLPQNYAGQHIADQLLRSSTSVAANYAEATEAESTADFLHKLKISMKELKESRVWLLFAARLSGSPDVSSLLDESMELIRMLGKSIATASKRAQANTMKGAKR